MKNNRTKKYCGLAVATLLLGGASLSYAQTANLFIQTFDSDASGTGREWGPGSVAFDGANGNPAGSLAVSVVFDGGSDTPSTAYICLNGGNPWYQPKTVDLSLYKSVQFDIKWDNTSDITVAEFNDLSTWPTTLTNSLGQTVFQSWATASTLVGGGYTAGFEVTVCSAANQMGPSLTNNMTIPAAAATGWAHITIPVNPALAGIGAINGLVFHKWCANTWALQNDATVRFWIDNVMLEGTAGPPPPPTLSLSKAAAGLNLFAASPSDPNNRYNIRTANAPTANYSWVGNGSTPVSYSFTITSYPGSAYPYFMMNQYLIPVPYDRTYETNGTVGLESAPDWNESTCIFMDLENYNDGSADWRFRYKTNSPPPNGNGTYYSDVQAELRDPAGILGTWTLTFVNNTSVTMTSPSGLSTNFVFSADKVAWFADNSGVALPLYYYVGCRANGAGNYGQGVTLSRARVQGGPDTIDDNFMADTNLDTTTWQMATAANSAIQLVPTTPAPVYWVNWTLPDTGFGLESNPTVTGPWNESGATPLSIAPGKKVLITASDLPGANQGYFHLAKRTATQLQVLLPGESNAPGTVSGKSGTPTPQQAGIGFDITVNACDGTWHIVSSVTDQVNFTSTDTAPYGATLPPDGTTALVNGTVSTTGASVYLLDPGTWTITATDVTTGSTITAATSSSVLVNP